MTFVLRIFFMGLIAFVPSRDGKELTVLLVETRPGYVASDGSLIPPHQPMLLARAAKCWGHCGIGNFTHAGFFFAKVGEAGANRLLSAALSHGAAWELDGSDLSIVDAQPSRAALSLQTEDSAERKAFGWIADLGQIIPSTGTVDPDVLACRPQKGLVTSRLRLKSGKVWTYRFIHLADKVLPVKFRTLQGTDEKEGFSRPIADWVAAEIEISGDSVEIVENRFGCGEIRTIRLAPENGLVELALMNIPPPPPQSFDGSHREHEPAAHFEMYYDLAQTPPPSDRRPVPHVPAQQSSLPPEPEKRIPSKLLDALTLGDPKGFYERILCPPARLSDGAIP